MTNNISFQSFLSLSNSAHTVDTGAGVDLEEETSTTTASTAGVPASEPGGEKQEASQENRDDIKRDDHDRLDMIRKELKGLRNHRNGLMRFKGLSEDHPKIQRVQSNIVEKEAERDALYEKIGRRTGQRKRLEDAKVDHQNSTAELKKALYAALRATESQTTRTRSWESRRSNSSTSWSPTPSSPSTRRGSGTLPSRK